MSITNSQEIIPLNKSENNLKTCQICNAIFIDKTRCNNHLRKHGITLSEYYDTFYASKQENKCLNCGEDTAFNPAVFHYRHYCSKRCSSQHHKIRVPCSEERKKKIALSKIGKARSKLSIQKQIESYKANGYRHSENTKTKIGLANIGKHSNMDAILRSAKTRKERNLPSKPKSEAFKLLMRQKTIERIKRNGGCIPSYNKKACEYFRELDEKIKSKGRYALYGGGEYCVKELGYFVDYINFDKKTIIEWDEKYHFYSKNIKRHEQRDRDIRSFFSDFLVIRILEKNPNPIEEIAKQIQIFSLPLKDNHR